MFSWLANAWRVPELRRRVLFTAMILAVYRLGSWIPAPGVNSETIENYFSGRGDTILGLLNLFSGGALSQFSLFALGIMPYVTASIILQLMTVVIPRLGELQKEGEAGYAKITQYALPHGRTRRSAGDRVCIPLPQPGRARRGLRRGRPDRHDADRGNHAPDVDGRADHEARDRERHLHPDLRVDPRRRADRHRRLVERRPDGEALLPVRSRSSPRSFRPGRPAAHPDPVREADGGSPNDGRRLDLPPVAG